MPLNAPACAQSRYTVSTPRQGGGGERSGERGGERGGERSGEGGAVVFVGDGGGERARGGE